MVRKAWLVVGLVVAATGPGCSCGTDSDDDDATATASGGSGGAGAQSSVGGAGAGINVGADIVSITIEPANAVVVVDNGTIPAPLQYTAIGELEDGTMKELTGTWEFDRPDLGELTQQGELTATGFAGGIAKVSFTSANVTGETDVTVRLEYTYEPVAIDQEIKDAFDAATDPDPSLDVLYPYDETVFPRGLIGPTIQWNGGGADDVYYIQAESPTFAFKAWTTVPPPSRFGFPTDPEDIWTKLTDSIDGDVQIDVQRYDGTQAYLPDVRTWKIAPAVLTGTIYYWEVNNGNVVRIKPGDTQPENFLQKPAGVTCVACHSVSADGSTLVASFHGGYSPWGTFDAADGSSIYAQDQASGFQAISPDGGHVLWRHWSGGGFPSLGYLSLSTRDDATELAQLNPGVGAPAHPAWSKDGDKIAFSVRTDGNGLDFTQSTLWIADVDLQAPAFSAINEIVPNDAQRPTVTFPTFSPDSQWIAFERATRARSRGALSEIWLTNLDGSTLIELDRLNGAGYLQNEQASASFEPTFLPVAVGGYYWLVIVSERTYGNILTSTNNGDWDNCNTQNPGCRSKQLWVSAIDANPQPGQDPSHPAFWLPGQGLDNQNMRGEWALSPCKQLGETCEAGYECCEGFCTMNEDGEAVCSEGGGCSNEGEACEVAADCCDAGADCIGGFCSAGAPK